MITELDKNVTSSHALGGVLLAIGAAIPLRGFASGISLGGIFCVLAAPVVLSAVRQSRQASRVVIIALVAVIWSVPTTIICHMMDNQRVVDLRLAAVAFSLLIKMLLTVVAIYFSAYCGGIRLTAFSFGLATGVVQYISAPAEWHENLWKYVFAWPALLIICSLIGRATKALGAAVMLLIAAFSLFQDTRNVALVAIASLLTMYAYERHKRFYSDAMVSHSQSVKVIVFRLSLIALSVAGAYALLVRLILANVFGSTLQSKEIDQSGIGVLGARIEILPTLGLFRRSPFGFGLGISPSNTDLYSVDSVMSAFGFTPGTSLQVNYLHDYVFQTVLASPVELHSIFWDYWYLAGVAGILAGVYFGYILLSNLVHSSQTDAPLLITFISLQSLWDLLFSPLSVNGQWFAASLGLGLAGRYLFLKRRE